MTKQKKKIHLQNFSTRKNDVKFLLLTFIAQACVLLFSFFFNFMVKVNNGVRFRVKDIERGQIFQELFIFKVMLYLNHMLYVCSLQNCKIYIYLLLY